MRIPFVSPAFLFCPEPPQVCRLNASPVFCGVDLKLNSSLNRDLMSFFSFPVVVSCFFRFCVHQSMEKVSQGVV